MNDQNIDRITKFVPKNYCISLAGLAEDVSKSFISIMTDILGMKLVAAWKQVSENMIFLASKDFTCMKRIITLETLVYQYDMQTCQQFSKLR